MKEIASSIIVLSAVFLLISAEYFDSLLFWIIGVIMLVDGTIIFVATTLFPKRFSIFLENINKKSLEQHI